MILDFGNMKLLTVSEFSLLIDCSINHTYRCIQTGEIPASAVHRFGRTIRINPSFLGLSIEEAA